MAPHILHDFGLDEQSEWGSDGEDQPARTSPSSFGKVSDWLSHMNSSEMENFVDVDELFMPKKEENDVEEEVEDYGKFEVLFNAYSDLR